MPSSRDDRRPRVLLEEHKIKESALDYGFSDEIFTIENFKKSLKIKIEIIKENEIEFDMIGVTPAFANAFRRIMICEVPSMAIEKVHISNNTSIIQDEILAHRLGLIPLKGELVGKFIETFNVFSISSFQPIHANSSTNSTTPTTKAPSSTHSNSSWK